jgi:hypothetical protein
MLRRLLDSCYSSELGDVLNGTLENAFRQWHQGFRPIAEPLQVAVAA